MLYFGCIFFLEPGGKGVLARSTTQKKQLPKSRKRERSLDQELLCHNCTSTSLTPIITDVSSKLLFTFLLYMRMTETIDLGLKRLLRYIQVVVIDNLTLNVTEARQMVTCALVSLSICNFARTSRILPASSTWHLERSLSQYV